MNIKEFRIRIGLFFFRWCETTIHVPMSNEMILYFSLSTDLSFTMDLDFGSLKQSGWLLNTHQMCPLAPFNKPLQKFKWPPLIHCYFSLFLKRAAICMESGTRQKGKLGICKSFLSSFDLTMKWSPYISLFMTTHVHIFTGRQV